MKMMLLIGNSWGRKGFTFLELMLTVSVLAVGSVGVFRALLASMEYQEELSRRLYAVSVMDNMLAVLENQVLSSDEFSDELNGQITSVMIEGRQVPFTFTMNTRSFAEIDGLMSVRGVLSWPDRGREIHIRRNISLFNLKKIKALFHD